MAVSSSGFASDYPSINGDYGRAVPDNHGNCLVNNSYRSGYLPSFRIYIPPGTTIVSVEILEWAGQSAIAHMGSPPTVSFGATPSSVFTLATLEAPGGKFFRGYEQSGRLGILSDAWTSPFLPQSRSGWLYVKLDGNMGSPSFYIAVSLYVNATAYNAWYSGIVWSRDVEGISPIPTITPSPTPIPTPTPVPTVTPGVITVSPNKVYRFVVGD